MGSFIRISRFRSQSARHRAFSSYNSQRVDFLIIDAFDAPVLAIEYHGTGHYLSQDAKARHAIKRLTLEKAGIPLVEFRRGASSSDIANKISDNLKV